MTDNVYAAAFQQYHEAGWRSILPLPPRAKKHPPGGYSGHKALIPSYPDLQTWADERPDSNVGIVMPDNIIGLDVDDYGDKHGGRTLTEYEEKWGELPATFRSTSRGAEDISGIRFFRVPEGLHFDGGLPPGIEVIQRVHRYAVVWPSIHPEGRTYRWYDADDNDTGIPGPADFPELPSDWVDGLEKAVIEYDLTSGELSTITSGEPNRVMILALERALQDLTGGGSRHDVTLQNVGRILRLSDDGHPGAGVVLLKLMNDFVLAIENRADRDAAEDEFRDLISPEIRKKIAATPSAEKKSKEGLARIKDDVEDEPLIDPDADFWEARPILRHIRTHANALMVSPWSTLLGVMLREITLTDPRIVLPEIVGRVASLNLFGVFVGESGGGKGTSEGAAESAVTHGLRDADPFPTALLGSGEGLVTQYMALTKGKPGDPGTPFMFRKAVLFTAAEVDTVAKVNARSGSTLLPELCKAYSGEALGHAYAAKEKRLTCAAHTYRLCVSIGAQPTRANVLLEEAESGLPQRFLWLPTWNPYAPELEDRPEVPEPYPVKGLADGYLKGDALHRVAVPEWIKDIVRQERQIILRTGLGGLDAHRTLTKLKVAAAFAILEGRVDIDAEDWELAGRLMKKSDETRQAIVDAIARQGRERLTATAISRADTDLLADERRSQIEHDRLVKKAAKLLDHFEAVGSVMSQSALRHKLASPDRKRYFDLAIELLVDEGIIERDEGDYQGQSGTWYRRLK